MPCAPRPEACSQAQGLLGKLAVALGVLHALLANDLLLNFREREMPSVCMRVLDVLEGDRGHEALRQPRVGHLGVELVNLLECEALGLEDHAPHEEDADEAATAPDEEDLCAQVGVAGAGIDHEGSGTEKDVSVVLRSGDAVATYYPIAQLRSQLDAVVMESDLARTLSGKISPVTTQATGPHEHAKKKM